MPHRVDIHVGDRIRQRRKELELSQSDLARALGMTFQQIQKYERGTNRVSASKLWETAIKLDVSLLYFFEGLGGAVPPTGPERIDLFDVLAIPSGPDILRLILAMTPPIRRSLKTLLVSIDSSLNEAEAKAPIKPPTKAKAKTENTVFV